MGPHAVAENREQHDWHTLLGLQLLWYLRHAQRSSASCLRLPQVRAEVLWLSPWLSQLGTHNIIIIIYNIIIIICNIITTNKPGKLERSRDPRARRAKFFVVLMNKVLSLATSVASELRSLAPQRPRPYHEGKDVGGPGGVGSRVPIILELAGSSGCLCARAPASVRASASASLSLGWGGGSPLAPLGASWPGCGSCLQMATVTLVC